MRSAFPWITNTKIRPVFMIRKPPGPPATVSWDHPWPLQVACFAAPNSGDAAPGSDTHLSWWHPRSWRTRPGARPPWPARTTACWSYRPRGRHRQTKPAGNRKWGLNKLGFLTLISLGEVRSSYTLVEKLDYRYLYIQTPQNYLTFPKLSFYFLFYF